MTGTRSGSGGRTTSQQDVRSTDGDSHGGPYNARTISVEEAMNKIGQNLGTIIKSILKHAFFKESTHWKGAGKNRLILQNEFIEYKGILRSEIKYLHALFSNIILVEKCWWMVS